MSAGDTFHESVDDLYATTLYSPDLIAYSCYIVKGTKKRLYIPRLGLPVLNTFPHPSLLTRLRLIKAYGLFNTAVGSSADFLMTASILQSRVIPDVIISTKPLSNFALGGTSNRFLSFISLYQSLSLLTTNRFLISYVLLRWFLSYTRTMLGF